AARSVRAGARGLPFSAFGEIRTQRHHSRNARDVGAAREHAGRLPRVLRQPGRARRVREGPDSLRSSLARCAGPRLFTRAGVGRPPPLPPDHDRRRGPERPRRAARRPLMTAAGTVPLISAIVASPAKKSVSSTGRARREGAFAPPTTW